MEAFVVSTGLVALAEIGDKTQILALLLAARFHRPGAVVLGILAATLANHALAGLSGIYIARLIDPDWLRWIVGLGFLAMALWALRPDGIEADAGERPLGRWGIFGVTAAAFFFAEIGDKTQIATVALAAKYQSLLPVIAGTTLGMLIADVPAVFLGKALLRLVPAHKVRWSAALVFVVIGLATLFGWGPIAS